MFGFEFANPKYFLLLILLVPMIVWYILKEKKSHADLQFSSLRITCCIKISFCKIISQIYTSLY